MAAHIRQCSTGKRGGPLRLIERENGFRRGVVMIGHSYGATTAVAMCNLLKRRIDNGMMEPVTVRLLVTIVCIIQSDVWFL